MFSKKFIQRTTEYTTFEKSVPAPYFRKRFFLANLPKSAQITVCGLGFYEGALVCFAIAIMTSLFFPKIEYWFSKNDKHTMLYIELAADANVNKVYDIIRTSNFGEIHKIDIVSPRSGNTGHIGIVLTLTLPKKSKVYSLEKSLCEVDGILFAVEL